MIAAFQADAFPDWFVWVLLLLALSALFLASLFLIWLLYRIGRLFVRFEKGEARGSVRE